MSMIIKKETFNKFNFESIKCKNWYDIMKQEVDFDFNIKINNLSNTKVCLIK